MPMMPGMPAYQRKADPEPAGRAQDDERIAPALEKNRTEYGAAEHAQQWQNVDHQRPSQDDVLRYADSHLIVNRAIGEALRPGQNTDITPFAIGVPVQQAMSAALAGSATAAGTLPDGFHPEAVFFNGNHPTGLHQHISAPNPLSQPPYGRY